MCVSGPRGASTQGAVLSVPLESMGISDSSNVFQTYPWGARTPTAASKTLGDLPGFKVATERAVAAARVRSQTR